MHAIVHVLPLNNITKMSQQLDASDTCGEYFNGFFFHL